MKTEWRKHDTHREAFKEESRQLEKRGGKDSPNNYNKINSPMLNYRKQDGEI